MFGSVTFLASIAYRIKIHRRKANDRVLVLTYPGRELNRSTESDLLIPYFRQMGVEIRCVRFSDATLIGPQDIRYPGAIPNDVESEFFNWISKITTRVVRYLMGFPQVQAAKFYWLQPYWSN